MFRVKFWHSAELARKQAYINVAKASLLRAHVLASPDPAYFISLLYSIIPWSGHSFQERELMHGLGHLEPCVHGLETAMITSSDLLGPPFLSSSSLYGSAPPPWNAPRWTHCSHVRHHAWAELSLPPESEEQDGQGGQIPEIKPLALARGRRKSSDHQRWLPTALMPS